MIGLPLIALLSVCGSGFKPGVQLSAWMIFDDDGSSFADFKKHAKALSAISYAGMSCDKKGVVTRPAQPTTSQIADLVKVAHANGVKAYAMAVNAGFTPEGLELAMSTPESMQAHADALVKIASTDGVDGIDLDYESLQGKDRDSFTKLVQIIAKAAHAKKLRVVMAVHAKESEPGTWDGPIAQDYSALGKAVDLIRVMTYDAHWETSEAGPIAPPDWAERVLTFASTEVPPAKLELGIPGYGYDWLGKKGQGITWTEWSARVKAHGGGTRDAASQELTLSYNGRTAFFSDGEASRAKFASAKKLGLKGLALWRMGSEDPAFWDLVAGEGK